MFQTQHPGSGKPVVNIPGILILPTCMLEYLPDVAYFGCDVYIQLNVVFLAFCPSGPCMRSSVRARVSVSLCVNLCTSVNQRIETQTHKNKCLLENFLFFTALAVRRQKKQKRPRSSLHFLTTVV